MSTAQNPALTYHEHFGPAIFIPMSRVTLAAAKPAAGQRVLDVACGSGIVTSQLPPLVGGTGRVVGLDISPGMLAVAAAQPAPQGATIEWKQGDGAAMDLPPAAFDLVICQHGLQFFPDRAAGAREMRRVLDDGGRAVVACWQGLEHQTFFASLIRSEARHMGITEAQAGMPFTFGNADELQAMLLAAGFARVEMQTHTIKARFPQPEAFLRMTIAAAASVMPALFESLDVDALAAKVTADCADDLARYRDGASLEFSMPTNLAVAYA